MSDIRCLQLHNLLDPLINLFLPVKYSLQGPSVAQATLPFLVIVLSNPKEALTSECAPYLHTSHLEGFAPIKLLSKGTTSF